MEKNYLHNLYKNLKLYDINISNNKYLKNKINDLIGGATPEEQAAELAEQEKEAAKLLGETQIQESIDQRDVIIQKLYEAIEGFLEDFERYKQQTSSNIVETDIPILNEIKDKFLEISTKIAELSNSVN
jgi:hypothetical protein